MINAEGKVSKNVILILCVFVFGSLLIFNALISKQADLIEKNRKSTITDVDQSNHTEETSTKRNLTAEPVFRTSYLDPNREFHVNILYQNEVEIARYKSNKMEMFDVEGTIPNGRVKFENKADGTKGVEHYQEGKRHGSYEEYYDNGRIKLDQKYFQGKLMVSKEYFQDGILRMEFDLQDALQIESLKETGVGKVFGREGTLMYEWNITYSGNGGYNKSYRRDGKLMEANYFDQKGQLIKTNKFE